MKEYNLPSGKASIETTGGLLATTEYTVPSKASERNKALHEALDQCLHLSAQRGQLQLQRDIERESVKQLTAERDALAATVEALREMASRANRHLIKGYALQRFDAANCNLALSALAEIDSFTPQQHLANLRAEAALMGWFECEKWFCGPDDPENCVKAANQYADSIRQGGEL